MKNSLKLLLLVLLLAAGAYSQTTINITTNSTDCSVDNSCAVLNITQNNGAAMFQLTGTWTGTVSFEATSDGTNWVAINVYPLNSTTAATTATANGMYLAPASSVAGSAKVRLRASAAITGTVGGTINPSNASARVGGGGSGGGDTITSPNSTLVVGGSSTNTTLDVIGLLFGSTAQSLSSTAPTSGQCLQYNGTNIIGGTCGSGITIKTNGTNNADQTGLNFLTSTVNSTGLTATPSNPSTTGEKFEISGSLVLSALATQAADTVVMNASGSTAVPTAVAMPTCTSGADLYNTTTHAWSCVTTGGGNHNIPLPLGVLQGPSGCSLGSGNITNTAPTPLAITNTDGLHIVRCVPQFTVFGAIGGVAGTNGTALYVGPITVPSDYTANHSIALKFTVADPTATSGTVTFNARYVDVTTATLTNTTFSVASDTSVVVTLAGTVNTPTAQQTITFTPNISSQPAVAAGDELWIVLYSSAHSASQLSYISQLFYNPY